MSDFIAYLQKRKQKHFNGKNFNTVASGFVACYETVTYCGFSSMKVRGVASSTETFKCNTPSMDVPFVMITVGLESKNGCESLHLCFVNWMN